MASKRGPRKPPEGETRNQRFTRLGNIRLRRTVDTMNSLARLASPFYQATPEQRAKVVAVLKDRFDRVEKAFTGEPEHDNTGPYL